MEPTEQLTSNEVVAKWLPHIEAWKRGASFDGETAFAEMIDEVGRLQSALENSQQQVEFYSSAAKESCTEPASKEWCAHEFSYVRVNLPFPSPCPWCEIERLRAELRRAAVEPPADDGNWRKFAEAMYSACCYLDKAIPVQDYPDNATRVRAAADEIERLQQRVTAYREVAGCTLNGTDEADELSKLPTLDRERETYRRVQQRGLASMKAAADAARKAAVEPSADLLARLTECELALHHYAPHSEYFERWELGGRAVTKEQPPSDRLPNATPAHTCSDGIVRIGTRESCDVCYPAHETSAPPFDVEKAKRAVRYDQKRFGKADETTGVPSTTPPAELKNHHTGIQDL